MKTSHRTSEGREKEGGKEEREGHPSSFDVWEGRAALAGRPGPITARLGVLSRLFSTLLYVLYSLVLKPWASTFPSCFQVDWRVL